MKLIRQLKYLYIRFIRLRGDPRELALGTALGVFAGMMPIVPFQTALAVTLAVLFKGSKITAALGTWVSNPLNWYFLYYYSYRTGVWILPGKGQGFTSVTNAISQKESAFHILGNILEAGGTIAAAFLVGGFLLGIVASVPSYFLSLKLFRSIVEWRKKRRTY